MSSSAWECSVTHSFFHSYIHSMILLYVRPFGGGGYWYMISLLKDPEGLHDPYKTWIGTMMIQEVSYMCLCWNAHGVLWEALLPTSNAMPWDAEAICRRDHLPWSGQGNQGVYEGASGEKGEVTDFVITGQVPGREGLFLSCLEEAWVRVRSRYQ